LFPLKDNLPTDRTPVVTIALIVLNVIAYLVLQPKTGIDFGGGSLDQRELVGYGAIPFEFTHPGQNCAVLGDPAGNAAIACGKGGGAGTAGQLPLVATVFTSMFSHAGLLHLGGNMLFLWVFGNNVEDSMGRVKFVAFYLLGGAAALLGQIIVAPDAMVPTLGASGAVAGVLGGYLLLYPRARVVTLVFIVLFFTILEIPAIFFLGFWFLQQIAFGALDLTNPTGQGGGVAYFAHVGGFAFGLLAVKLFADRAKAARVSGPKYPVY
jgi:membrane associated rhomboid family serine protease